MTSPQIPPIEDTGAGWAVMLHDFALYWWRRVHRGEEPDQWPPPWAVPAAAIAGLAVVVAVVAGLIVPLVRVIARFLARSVAGGAGWLHEWSIARVVLDPVRAWLAGHVGALPVDADTLWWTWSITGAVLFLLAALTTTAGRIGWIGYGGATTAMVYAATAGPGRLTAAGITVLWWLVLSVPALHRQHGRRRVYAYLPQLFDLAAVLRPRPAATDD